MSRTAITVTRLERQAAIATASTNAASGGHTIDLTKNRHGIILQCTNGSGGSITCTVAGRPASTGLGGFGDLVVTIPDGQTRSVWVTETQKYVQAGGVLNVDVSATSSVTLAALTTGQG